MAMHFWYGKREHEFLAAIKSVVQRMPDGKIATMRTHVKHSAESPLSGSDIIYVGQYEVEDVRFVPADTV